MTVETKAPPVEKCARCGAPLPRSNGHLSYWCENVPHPTEPGWLLTVKICHECRHREDDTHGNQRV